MVIIKIFLKQYPKQLIQVAKSQKMQQLCSNINLSKHNKQINKPMQQNVQSQRHIEAFNHSLQRNSLPSRIPQSVKVLPHRQIIQSLADPNKLQNEKNHNSSINQTVDKLKLIDEEIQKEKELIERLRIQNEHKKQQLQNTFNKSFVSLDPKQLKITSDNSIEYKRNQLFETQTQVDFSLLEDRKNQAIKQIETEQDKYRQNIRKMQLKKIQMKKKQIQQAQIPIKIMNFKQLQIKRQTNQAQVEPQKNYQALKQQKSVSKKDTQNKSSNKSNNFNLDKEITIKSTQKVVTGEVNKSLLNQQNQRIETQSQKFRSSQPKQVEQKKSHRSIINKDKFSSEKQISSKRQKSQSKQKASQNNRNIIAENDANENKSRLTGKDSNKKYSVKISSVVVPQFNESIKQIQQRKSHKRYQNQQSAKGSTNSKNSNNLQPEISQKSDIKIPTDKKQIQILQGFAKTSEKLQIQVQNLEKSQKQTIKAKSFHEVFPNQKQKPVYSVIQDTNFDQKRQILSVKQKSVSVRSKSNSKKSQKIELMYVPNAVKQKSFKKTDKSIQWSEVDVSMYGKTNELLASQNQSHIVNQKNQQSLILAVQNNVENDISPNKINMKKIRHNQNNFFQQQSEIQKKSKKSINLEPIPSIEPSKQKSIKQSVQSRSNKNKTSVAASRQGSVKEKVDRYNKFHRQHSLKNQKQSCKNIQEIDQLQSSKGISYRSRKSNPLSNSKSKTLTKEQNKIQSKEPSIQLMKNSSGMNESKVLISKEEISLLYSHIKRLEEKLQMIQQKQQKLAKDKTQQLQRLHQIAIEEERIAVQELKNSINIEKIQKLEIQNAHNTIDHQQIKTIEKVESIQTNVEKQETEKIQKQNGFIAGTNIQQTKTIELQPILVPQHSLREDKKIQETEEQIQNNKNGKLNTIQTTQQKQIPQNFLQKSILSQKQTIQHEINQIAEIQAKFKTEKLGLLDQINRLKKVIRQMQIQKIKSIDHQRTINSHVDAKSQSPQAEINQLGVIVHQNKKNQTLDPIKLDLNHSIQSEHQEINHFGKIVRNSTDKNNSKIIQNLDDPKSGERKFRISASKKTSHPSEFNPQKNFESVELPSVSKNVSSFDEQGNDQLLKKRKDSYPINQKQGYIVVSNQKQQLQNNIQKVKDSLLVPNASSKIIQQVKTRKSQITKDEVLQRFHRTNQQFNNFVQSSRIVNETYSSMSSQNNLFFDKNHHSGSFAIAENKVVNQQEEINPQNKKLLHKVSSSNLEIQKNIFKEDPQQSYNRIVNNMQNQTQDDQQDDGIPQIKVGDIEMPDLPQTPDISYDQDKLMQLAKSTFKIFEIEVNANDADFNMKKYKNCVIFTKGTQTILWHYNGKFYLGGWKGKQDGSGEKTGYGIQIVPDKHIYKGQFMNGKKHGTGIMKTTNGNFYDGQWIEGIKNGQGIYYDSTTKVVYSGEWKDGKKNGFGVLKFSQKQYYKGTFVRSVKDGYGIEVFVNGDKYQGEYRKGKFHGKGKYTWANTSAFQGDFYEGMRHGHGTWRSGKIDADIYVGTYQNDKKSGYGRYVWSNGCIYEGNFAQDVKHGKGRLIYTDGRQIRGVWQQGSLLQAVTENPREYNQQEILKRSRKIKIK